MVSSVDIRERRDERNLTLNFGNGVPGNVIDIAEMILWLERGTLFLCKEEHARENLLVTAHTILGELAKPPEEHSATALCTQFNRGALVLLKAGAFHLSQECVIAQMRLCRERFLSTGTLEWLQLLVQPIINLARLYAQAGKTEDALNLLSEIQGCTDKASVFRVAGKLISDDRDTAHCAEEEVGERDVITNCFVADSIRACLYNADYGRLELLLANVRSRANLSEWQQHLLSEAEILLMLQAGQVREALSLLDALYKLTKICSPPDPSILLHVVRAYRLLGEDMRADKVLGQLSLYASQLSERGFDMLAKRILYFVALDYAKHGYIDNMCTTAARVWSLSRAIHDEVAEVRSQLLLWYGSGEWRHTHAVEAATTQYATEILLSEAVQCSYGRSDLVLAVRRTLQAASVSTTLDIAGLKHVLRRVTLPPIHPTLRLLYNQLQSTAEFLA